MTIISVRENENSRWKRNTKNNNSNKKTKQKQAKTEKRKGGTKAVVKGWELNDFVVHLS